MNQLRNSKTQQTLPASDPLSQFHRDNLKSGRGKKIASTVLLILSGLLLYADNFAGKIFDLTTPVPNFITLQNFIYAMEMAVSPVIIIFASRMKPFRLAYLVPLYAYMNMIIGNVIFVYGYQVFDFWWYRLLIAGSVIPVYFVLDRTIKYYEGLEMQERLKDKLIKSYQKQYDEE